VISVLSLANVLQGQHDHEVTTGSDFVTGDNSAYRLAARLMTAAKPMPPRPVTRSAASCSRCSRVSSAARVKSMNALAPVMTNGGFFAAAFLNDRDAGVSFPA
jgi:hypothetical protein